MSEAVLGWGIVLAISSVTVAAIVNSAVGSYEDSKGHSYGAGSNVATVSIAPVSALTVSPKQLTVNPGTDGVTGGTVATKTFTITNDSNISDAYIVSGLTVSAGSVQSIAFTPAGAAPIAALVGSTVSPTVQIGQSLTVTVAVSTAGAAIGSNVTVALSAKTTAASANGPQTDTGKEWIYVARGPAISGIGAAAGGPPGKSATQPILPVGDLVNGSTEAEASPGETLNFALPFTNIGDGPAVGIVIVDQIPAQLDPVAGSVALQSSDPRTGKNVPIASDARVVLNGNTLTATIPLLQPGVNVAIVFKASPLSSVPIGTTIENPATISAQSLADIAASPSIVFIGVMNTVYDGLGDAAHPITGATVSLVDPGSGLPAKLPAAGNPPNTTNTNPFSTPLGGTFGFTLASGTGREADFDLDVKAAGYLDRTIKLAVVRGSDGLPTTTLTALDAQPLANAGGFNLTAAPVTVTRVSGFFGNVPLFSPGMLKLTLAVDRTVASAGDRLEYTVDFGPGSRPVPGAPELSIVLPPGEAYARGTARLGTSPSEPVIAARTLTWALKDLAQSRAVTFDAAVQPGATEGVSIRTQAHLGVMILGAPFGIDASVDVAIVGGPLSTRSILTGRVFADHGRDGRYAPGDLGLAHVRIYLEDGESVQTDLDGRFSFPAARPGMHVLHLDPITLPAGMHPYRGFAVNDSRSSLRLVHGIFDSGLMDDVNFAISEGAIPE